MLFAAGGKAVVGLGYVVELDDSVLEQRETLAIDFAVSTFSRKNSESPLLNVYSGGAPNLDKLIGAKGTHVLSINGLKGLEKASASDQGTSREGFVKLPLMPNGRQLYVHFWYENLSRKDALVADRIIASLRADSRRY